MVPKRCLFGYHRDRVWRGIWGMSEYILFRKLVRMRQPQKSPIIYLPIEVKTRELDSRLLLTIELLQRGFHVVLGVGHEIKHRLPQLPKGIVLVKGITPIEVELMREIRS